MSNIGQILIIDDNPTNIQVASGILEEHGYETEFALDGQTAFRWLDSKQFDVILLDIMIPEMDGFEICRIIKNNPQWKIIPVIFVTAKADKQSLFKGFEIGGEDYLTKPFDSGELIARVRTHIELKKSKEELIRLNEQLTELLNFKESKLKESSSDLIAVNNELSSKNTELEKIEVAKRVFFKVVGNEVGTSLHDITGMLQVIKHKVDSRKVAQLVDRIDHSLLKLETLVNTSVRITELQISHKHLTPERLELNKLIGFSMFQMDEKIRRKQIHFHNNSINDTIYILGEGQLLKACFMIIFDFFAERNPPNSIIQMEFNKLEQGLIINFSDEGSKLTNNEIDTLFDLFNLGNQSLSLVKMIVEAHLGVISVYNKNESGICLSISFFSNEKQTLTDNYSSLINSY
jgi:DNA-binding response OmpR family regulator